ncbi:MAG: NIL domain-containing protein [Desulfatiglandales bacterium]|nr:NIL domain-containing protein [Desulfatiglandales bacterium]
MKRKVYLTFPRKLIQEPLIYQVGHQFDVVTNIRCANVTEELGLMGLEFQGEASEIEAALNFLDSKGVKVEPVVMDVVE